LVVVVAPGHAVPQVALQVSLVHLKTTEKKMISNETNRKQSVGFTISKISAIWDFQ
jgi:hypothetical protein